MSNAKPTPKPWKTDKIFGHAFGYEVTDNNGNTIADCYKNSYYFKDKENGRERGFANADYIVKCVNSHDLLVETLKYAKEIILRWQSMGMDKESAFRSNEIYEQHSPEMKKINAVIKKATE